MSSTAEELARKKCVPCEGGVPRLSREEAGRLVADLSGWGVSGDGLSIRKEWTLRNFMAAMDFFNKVASLAEDEGHHPDLHLTGYRKAAIELTTHAINGLSENDFILAAKIDQIPVASR
jgi:4a-hydroxytetrahydrobiopterin dehydratase